MMRSEWRKHRKNDPAELNITAFMNLMVILVPFLLITAVFSRLAILELNLPSSNDQPDMVPETIQLEVILRADRIEIGERNLGLMTVLPMVEETYDLFSLTEYLNKLDATILLEPDVSYELLVQVMDAVRLFESDQDGKLIQAELFPEISIGDAPVLARS
jgi:biopolymer transport protein ExbD